MNKPQGGCESCAFYAWHDEEYEYYVCEADLGEDEMSAFLRGSDFSCLFYQPGDEYRVVRKTDVGIQKEMEHKGEEQL